MLDAVVWAGGAIVASLEDVAGGQGVDAGVVGDGVAAVYRIEAFAARQRLAVALIAADGRARRIDILERGVAMIIWALRDHEIGDPFTRDGDAVEDDLAGAHLDRIAGKADHALDIILLVGGRRLEDDDIAAGRQTAEDPARNQRRTGKA